MVRLRSAGPMEPATSRPMMALASTVRHGSRLSFWNTKPRSEPGSFTERPSSSTSPDEARSRPATMRKNVVLPQPLGPTTEMNSPRSTSRLMPRSASRSPNVFDKRAMASLDVMRRLILGPRHQPLFQPAETRRHDDAGNREHHAAGEQFGHVESVGGLADQPAKASARAEQLSHHDADQAAADAEFQAGKDERHRRRQRHLKEDLPRRGAERAQHLDQPLARRAQSGLGVDRHREQDQENDHDNLLPEADPEPENEQRRQRDGRCRVKPRDPRLQRLFHGGARRHGEP